MKYANNKSSNIKVLNSIRSLRRDRETDSYYHKLNPHLQKLVLNKGSELADIIIKEDIQQVKQLQQNLRKSDIKFSFQNFNIAALQRSPNNSILSSKPNFDCQYSNSVASFHQNIKSDRMRNVQRS